MAETHDPVAVVTGAGAGHRGGHRRGAWPRPGGGSCSSTGAPTTRRWATRWPPRPTSRRSSPTAGAPSGPWPCVADVRDQAAPRRGGGHRRGRASAGSTPRWRRPAASSAARPAWETRRRSGRPWSASTSRACGGWPAPPSPPCWPGPRRGRGRFVAVSSAGGVGRPAPAGRVHRRPSTASYGLVRSLAAELGPYGITANAVAPGSTTHGDARRQRRRLRARPPRRVRQPPPPRAGSLEPAEVAAAVAWLCCAGQQRDHRGRCCPVDAGMTASP